MGATAGRLPMQSRNSQKMEKSKKDGAMRFRDGGQLLIQEKIKAG